MDGVVSEVRSVSFSDQVFSNMVVAILRELAQGPTGEIDSPALPLLGDLLTADPVLVNSESTGGSVIELEFAYNLDDMLEAYGLTRAQSMASLCYTLCTFFPNVSGIRVSINDTPVSQLQLEEDQDVSISFAENVLLRTRFFHLALRLLYPVLCRHGRSAPARGQASRALHAAHEPAHAAH